MIVVTSAFGFVLVLLAWAFLVIRNDAKDYAKLDTRHEKTLFLLADLYDYCEHCCGSDVVRDGWCGDHDPDLRTQVKEFLAEEGLG
jgi:hypothetical protein